MGTYSYIESSNILYYVGQSNPYSGVGFIHLNRYKEDVYNSNRLESNNGFLQYNFK